jgi:hypothetical protein
MKTKLVYVLTCAPEATYIEQALISIWSARYHNPDAHIVLLIDDLTNQLLVGKRAEVLDYITEKVVVSFEDANATMMYRSRWMKTSVRQLIEGDLLFIDCDTIITQSLAEIDNCSYDVAMVPDEHMSIKEYPNGVLFPLIEYTQKLEYDVTKEDWYYNSGVMYAKDKSPSHELWNSWHNIWLEGEILGVGVDQPALGKANIQCNHIISTLPDVWNTLIYMNPIFAHQGKILHFWNFRNRSYIFCEPFLKYVRANGMNNYVQDCVLHPLKSILPSDNILNITNLLGFIMYSISIKREKHKYAKYVDSTFSDFPWKNGFNLFDKFIKIKVFKRGKTKNIYYT